MSCTRWRQAGPPVGGRPGTSITGGRGIACRPRRNSSCSAISSRTMRRALSGDVPAASSAASRSNKCWESSSTIASSRSAGRSSPSSRRLTSSRHLSMFHLRDPGHGRREALPGGALGGEYPPAFAREAIETPAALAGFFRPPAFQPTARFEPVEHRVQRGHFEPDAAVGSLVDETADLIAVPRPGFDERQDHQLGAPLLELAIEAGRPYMLHSNMLYHSLLRTTSGVDSRSKGNSRFPFSQTR